MVTVATHAQKHLVHIKTNVWATTWSCATRRPYFTLLPLLKAQTLRAILSGYREREHSSSFTGEVSIQWWSTSLAKLASYNGAVEPTPSGQPARSPWWGFSQQKWACRRIPAIFVRLKVLLSHSTECHTSLCSSLHTIPIWIFLYCCWAHLSWCDTI